MAQITIVGCGYVGLVTGACFARLGHQVACLDIDEEKVQRLRQGQVPIYEPGLDLLVQQGLSSGRLTFGLDVADSVPGSSFVFIAVQTPTGANGKVDMRPLVRAVQSVLPHMSAGTVLIQKSTAPIGTGQFVARLIASEQYPSVSLVVNPEFLRESTAIEDFMNPDRIIVGSSDRAAAERVAVLYDFSDCPVVVTNSNTAEMIKYASNCFLATKISFMNEIASICEHNGVDVRQVSEGMSHDRGIGPGFLRAGIGWGGSCLPKDLKALIQMSDEAGQNARLLQAVQKINSGQIRRAVRKLETALGSLEGTVIGLLGLAFKPGTDDMRFAPSLQLADALRRRGATVRAHDPVVAIDKTRGLAPYIDCYSDPYEMASEADALALVTEWPEFRQLDMGELLPRMRCPVLLDGRNFWDRRDMEDLGFTYAGFGIGSPADVAQIPSLIGIG